MPTYEWVENVPHLAGEVQPDSIVSRTLYKNDHARAVLFTFDAGQFLSEHQAGQPALISILEGEATVTLGEAVYEAHPGSLIDMAAGLTHRVYAKTRLVMLLILLQKAAAS